MATTTNSTQAETNPAGSSASAAAGSAAPTQAWLDARAVIAGDLYRDGEITRQECWRLEMDAVLGEDSGPINYDPNADFEEASQHEREEFAAAVAAWRQRNGIE